LLTTATHDHKRGEDLRARLAVLTEFAGEWQAAVGEWRELNRPVREQDGAAISAADELMLYQMIVGAWPPMLGIENRAGCDDLAHRLAGWLEKAQREAKLATSWTNPNGAYENASQRFLQALFRPEHGFLRRAAAFADGIAGAGALNGLAQTVLKLTAPGVPDFFQGSEFWDFSLVDPDNRRPVDFAARIAALNDRPELPALASVWRNGHVKQATIAQVLAARAAAPAIFQQGAYLPVATSGTHADKVVAFLRRAADQCLLVVVPRTASRLLADGLTIPAAAWADTRLALPAAAVGAHATEVLCGRSLVLANDHLQMAELLSPFPIAVLRFDTPVSPPQ
jgi:(1->4)-alpha-D-glucan 1-alpha-D-glucosylmutase